MGWHSAEYTTYMDSDAWRHKRALALTRARNRCQHCGKSGVRLEIHHTSYARLGVEADEDLIALCVGCHKNADTRRKAGRKDAAIWGTL